MQNFKQMAADIFRRENFIFAVICSALILCARIIYLSFPPSWLRFGMLIIIGVLVFFLINSFRINHLISLLTGITYPVFSLRTLKEGFLLTGYYLLFILTNLFAVTLEFVFCALIKTDMLYFIILAIFTSLLFLMFFFTFIAGIELEYITKGFNQRILFAFGRLAAGYSANKLARFTAVSVLELVVFVVILYASKCFSNLFVFFFIILIVLLAVFKVINFLESYKIKVYNSNI